MDDDLDCIAETLGRDELCQIPTCTLLLKEQNQETWMAAMNKCIETAKKYRAEVKFEQ